MPRELIVHGHFYQPSREDPLTGRLPKEACPSPYANWNECIYQTCYRPNAELGNFRKISFDIGPTLFRWLEENHADTYQDILDQERENYQIYGVSNAMGQSYYHLILPLASTRDKQTQLHWGIQEYQHRFHHTPQGLWLPETAVDIETLEIMADEDIEFTILAPWQAQEEPASPRQPCLLELPSGNNLTIFYYDAGLSGQLSFYPPATRNATAFVQEQVLPAFKEDEGVEKMILLASDGELYGHHQRFRDKFLAYLLDGAAKEAGLTTAFPAQWMNELPVDLETTILPGTSWSCHHGIERWRGVCEDAPLATWKEPLRKALDHLADSIDQIYERILKPIVKDVWELRMEYIEVILGQRTSQDLIKEYSQGHLSAQKIKSIHVLLQAQDNRMKMFASDAWFFEDFNRIEPRNAIRYATYAAWLVSKTDFKGNEIFEDLKKELSFVKNADGTVSGDAIAKDYWTYLQKA